MVIVVVIGNSGDGGGDDGDTCRGGLRQAMTVIVYGYGSL